jgi:hypothetical protein
VNTDIWLGALTTLIGAGLGGVISLALNRQQMSDARRQRSEDEVRLRERRSEDRRFDAYSQFSLALRSYRDNIRTLEDQHGTDVPVDDINMLAKSVNSASALVFFVVESEDTYKACRSIVSSVHETQRVLHSGDRSLDLWIDLNNKTAELVREFQVAARDELRVGGIGHSTILTRANSSAKSGQ